MLGAWPAPGLRARVLDAVPPASGAVVMGTGIVSIALSLDAQESLSRVFAALDGVTWVALALLLPARGLADRARFRSDVRTPAALTAVAGTGVLGTRLGLLGWNGVAAALLVIALVLWLFLVPQVLRHWRVPTVGVSFVLTVATESLALVATVIAQHEGAQWLLWAALVPFVLGLCFYVFVLSRFDWRQLAVGAGDHWVTGGALAISTVVAGRIALTAQSLGMFTGAHDALDDLALALWCATACWLPVLLVAEALRPRLRYDVRRWSTVFPVGMYAASSFIVGAVAALSAITDFARGWVWVAVAVWAVVFGAMLGRAAAVIGGPAPRRAP